MTNNETTQVAVTEEMRASWARQFATVSREHLDMRIASLIKALAGANTLAKDNCPANQVDAAREMLAAAKAWQDAH